MVWHADGYGVYFFYQTLWQTNKRDYFKWNLPLVDGLYSVTFHVFPLTVSL